MRYLKRLIADVLYRRLRAEDATGVDAGPGGQRGPTRQSSAAGFHSHIGTSDQPLPGPGSTTTRKTKVPKVLQPAP